MLIVPHQIKGFYLIKILLVLFNNCLFTLPDFTRIGLTIFFLKLPNTDLTGIFVLHHNTTFNIQSLLNSML